jgi:hypothetical protein
MTAALAALAALTANTALAQRAAATVPIAPPAAAPAAPAPLPAGPATVMPIMSSIPDRVAQADAIVVGKVTGLEKQTVSARPTPQAAQKSEYQIAKVKIGDALVGIKGLTDIRVGFIARQNNIVPPPRRGGAPQPLPAVRPAIVIYQPTLTVGQEGVLFLNKHFDGDFYVLTGYQSVINKLNNANYEKELALVKRCVKLLDKPATGLKAKDSSERLLTASLLLSHYRAFKPGMIYPIKTEPISAKESKLILSALIDADWDKIDPELRMNARTVFSRLGVAAKDGWTPPRYDPAKAKDYNAMWNAAAKDWLKKNADTYRVQRYVREKPAKQEPKTK